MALHGANEVQKVKQPIIWGKVIVILVCHLLAVYGLLTLPFIQIRWQTYVWGKNQSLCPFWSTSELPAVQAMFLQLFRKNVQVYLQYGTVCAYATVRDGPRFLLWQTQFVTLCMYCTISSSSSPQMAPQCCVIHEIRNISQLWLIICTTQWGIGTRTYAMV
jgi:hypothetical protein